jgi:hypothetical protein
MGHGEGRGSTKVSRDIFKILFLNNNFPFWAVFSQKSFVLENEKYHVTRGGGPGVLAIVPK